MVEAVSRRFKISTINFRITSTRTMSRYYFFPLGISTTAFHVVSSASRPSPNAICTRSTTLSQLEASAGVFSLLSYIPSLPVPSGPVAVPSVRISWSAAASSLSFFLASANYPFKCAALIPEGSPER